MSLARVSRALDRDQAERCLGAVYQPGSLADRERRLLGGTIFFYNQIFTHWLV